MSYGTSANVQAVSYLITNAVNDLLITETNITDAGDLFAQPVIDASLYGRGAPFTTAPSIITMIWSLLTAAHIFRDRLSHNDDAEGLAGGLEKKAMDLLKDIQEGTLQASGVTALDLMTISDPTDDRPATEVFTGTALDWQDRTETRES